MQKSEATEQICNNEENQTLAPWAAPGEFFDGTHYLLQGGNALSETVVCMHGIGSFYIYWKPLADKLCPRGYRVLYYDLIGRGFSQGSKTGNYGENEHIDQIRSLLEHLSLTTKKLHILGHSMGGALATLYASKYPENVKSLVLLAPAGTLGYFPLQCAIDCCPCFHTCVRSHLAVPANQEYSWRHAYYRPAGQALENLNNMIGELHKMYANNSHAHDAFWLSAIQFPLTNIESEIRSIAQRKTIPILIVWGKNDIIVPISNLSVWMSIFGKERGKSSSNEIESVQTKIFENCGHSIMGEHRQDLLKTIEVFLDQFSTTDTVNIYLEDEKNYGK